MSGELWGLLLFVLLTGWIGWALATNGAGTSGATGADPGESPQVWQTVAGVLCFALLALFGLWILGTLGAMLGMAV